MQDIDREQKVVLGLLAMSRLESGKEITRYIFGHDELMDYAFDANVPKSLPTKFQEMFDEFLDVFFSWTEDPRNDIEGLLETPKSELSQQKV